jgi:two-component SAPR family response regulator
MKNERVVLIDNDNEAYKTFFKMLKEENQGHRLEGMAASEEELMCLLRDGIRPTALVINSELENGKHLAELMRRRSPNVLIAFFSGENELPWEEGCTKEIALQNVAKELATLHH